MEVALFTLFRLFTLLPLITLSSQLKLLKQWHVWLYEQKVEWTGLYWTVLDLVVPLRLLRLRSALVVLKTNSDS